MATGDPARTEETIYAELLTTGETIDVPTVVTLTDNTTAGVEIAGAPARGTASVLVRSSDSGGATGEFMMSRSKASEDARVVRLISAAGDNGEQVVVSWRAGENMKLAFSVAPVGGTGATVIYKVNIRTIGA